MSQKATATGVPSSNDLEMSLVRVRRADVVLKPLQKPID